MKKLKFTAAALATLPKGQHADPLLRGLQLVITSRTRAWSLRVRVKGKQLRIPLGYYAAIGLADARQAARSTKEAIDKGETVQPSQAHPRTVETVTLGDALARYERMRQRKGDKIKSLPEAMRAMRRAFGKHLTQPLKSFDRAAMREVRDDLDASAPIMANRLIGYAGPLFNYFEDEELIDLSPLHRVRKIATERKRDRVLTNDEVKTIWWACDALPDHSKAFGRLVRFLLATAQRRMEGAELRYRSLIGGYWKQLASENKSNREHKVKLPSLAWAQIGQGEPNELVFGTSNGGVLGNFDRMKKELQALSKTAGWSLHDLRRTGATRMAELGISRDVIDAVLNHVVSGVASHYVVTGLDTLKADALEKWNAELCRIIGTKPALAVVS